MAYLQYLVEIVTYHNIRSPRIFEYRLSSFDFVSIPKRSFQSRKTRFAFFTRNVPFGYFINETSRTSVGNKLAVSKAIIKEIEQTHVTK